MKRRGGRTPEAIGAAAGPANAPTQQIGRRQDRVGADHETQGGRPADPRDRAPATAALATISRLKGPANPRSGDCATSARTADDVGSVDPAFTSRRLDGT